VDADTEVTIVCSSSFFFFLFHLFIQAFLASLFFFLSFFPKEPSSGFPHEGITLEGIKYFISSHGGEEAFTGLRTTDICDKFLKLVTLDHQDSYCLAFKGDSTRAGHIYPATAFVSHAWGQEFLDVVAALEDYESRQPISTVFWFDIFSNNQHKAPNREFTWWQTVFTDSIERLKNTLLVLEWDDPKPLKRAWCLWEMVSTVNTKCNFQIIMSPKNHKSFSTALVEDFNSLAVKICNVEVKNAESFNRSDRDNIFKAVEATAGFEEVNKQVIRLMREWMVMSGKEALLGLPEEKRAVSKLQTNLASLLFHQGKINEAEPLYREALEVSRRTLGDTHSRTFAIILEISDVLQELGKLSEAEGLLREALELQETIYNFKEAGPIKFLILTALGNVLLAQDKLADAEPFIIEALDGLRQSSGDTHHQTLHSILSLAGLLKEQGKLDEAGPLFREALAGYRQTLGDTHPSTVGCIRQVASFFHHKGSLIEAEPLYRESLEVRRRISGDTHPETLAVISLLAVLLENLGKKDEAETLYSQMLEGKRQSLGDTHPSTLSSMFMLAMLHLAHGKLDEAERGLRGALEAPLVTLILTHSSSSPP